jgi:hypothetical protein
MVTARLIGIAPHEAFPAQGQSISRTYGPFDAKMNFNEAIVSWDVSHPKNAALKVQVRPVIVDHKANWYTLANWAGDEFLHPRESVNGQSDADGEVRTDTLHLNQPARILEVEVEMSTIAPGPTPELKLLTVSFADTTANPVDFPEASKAWGQTIGVPQRAQDDYPNGGVLCSPTSVSMVLAFYAQKLHRPELDQDVAQVSDGVWDTVYKGAGNWPFNTAFAGGFDGMFAYVARFNCIRDIQAWTENGFPVICSVSYDMLRGKPLSPTEQGHLVVLIGFTKDGDPIFNDPASKGAVRQTYKRSDFQNAWNYSHRTVYLIYPEGVRTPHYRYNSGLWYEVPL